MTNKISGACRQKASWVGARNPSNPVSSCSHQDRFPGMSFTTLCKVRAFLEALSRGEEGLGEGGGRWGHVGVHLSVYKVGMGLLPAVLTGWHQAHPPTQVHETGVVGCPAQGETTLPGILGPRPVGPSLWTLFLLLPSYFQSFCQFFLFSRSWTKCLLPSWSLNPLLKKNRAGLAQTCSCAGLSGVLGRHCRLKARGLRSLGPTTSTLLTGTVCPGQSPTSLQADH